MSKEMSERWRHTDNKYRILNDHCAVVEYRKIFLL